MTASLLVTAADQTAATHSAYTQLYKQTYKWQFFY